MGRVRFLQGPGYLGWEWRKQWFDSRVLLCRLPEETVFTHRDGQAIQKKMNSDIRLKSVNWFIWSVVTIFVITSLLKLISVSLPSQTLDKTDYLMPFLTRRQFLLIAALAEILLIVAICINLASLFAIELIFGFSVMLLGYRLIVFFYGDGASCNCLGVFDEGRASSGISFFLLAWCLTGSASCWIVENLRRRNGVHDSGIRKNE